MALAMSRPFKHPKTGIYWFRKVVPEALRPLVGKVEEKRSLGTRDAHEAKRKHAQITAEIEERWENLRRGPAILSERDAHSLTDSAYDDWLKQHGDNPSEQHFWRTSVYELLWAPMPYDMALSPSENLRVHLTPERFKAGEMRRWCEHQASECLKAHGLVVDETSHLKVARSFAAAIQRASLMLEKFAQGDLSHFDRSSPATATMKQTVTSSEGPAVLFETLIRGWAAERRPAERTVYEWRRVFGHLRAFVGHDDARRLTADDILAWKQSLVAAGLRPKTVRDAKLTPVRSVLGWATDNRLLPANPAEKIRIDVKAKASETILGFNDEQAATILKASLAAKDPVRRWIPWLCAYSGARLSEICQLRREDILETKGIWVMKISPDAGSVKTLSSERDVPLHPALIEGGFLTFVERSKPGPLFTDLPPNKFGSRGGNGTKVLGRWVRSLGLDDKRLSPNHSWRHRMKTLGRRHGLAPDLLSALVGHARKSVADRYGEFEIDALHRELCKIPSLQLSMS